MCTAGWFTCCRATECEITLDVSAYLKLNYCAIAFPDTAIYAILGAANGDVLVPGDSLPLRHLQQIPGKKCRASITDALIML